MTSTRWTSAASTSRRSSSMKLACTSEGLSVNSSSNWSTTRTASSNCPRHLDTTARAVSASSNPSSRAIAAGSPEWSGASARASDSVGASPGVKTTTRQPGGARGATPARSSELLPTPEGPITASSRRALILRHSAAALGLAAEETVGVGLGEGGQPGIRVVLLLRRWRRLGDWRCDLVGRGHRMNLRDQPVAALADGLDVAGVLGVVAEGVAELADPAGDGAVGHELGLPDGVEQVVSCRPPPRRAPPGRAGRRWPSTRAGPRPLGTGEPVQGGLDEPVPDEERPAFLGDGLNLGGHSAVIVAGAVLKIED